MNKFKYLFLLLFAVVAFSQESYSQCCQPVNVLFHGQIVLNDFEEAIIVASGKAKMTAIEVNRVVYHNVSISPFGYYQIIIPSCDIIVLQPFINGKGIEGYGQTVFDVYKPSQGFYDLRYGATSYEVQTDFLFRLVRIGQ